MAAKSLIIPDVQDCIIINIVEIKNTGLELLGKVLFGYRLIRALRFTEFDSFLKAVAGMQKISSINLINVCLCSNTTCQYVTS